MPSNATERPYKPSGQYDSAARRAAVRRGRERGCWVYIPQAELHAAGLVDQPPPFYRTTGYQRSRNGHTVIVNLYREP